MRQPDTMTRIAAVRGAALTAGVPGVTALLDHARGLLEQHTAPVLDPRTDSGLRMRCLGGFDLERDGRTVDCSSLRPRARSLLLLLAIHHGRDVHRERLIDALWPDAPPDAGTHRLQVAASAVRQCLATAGLGDHAVQRHADAYRLDLADAWVDLAEFEDRSDRARRAATRGDTENAVGQWSAALELYAGELLPEVGPAEWVLADRERLRLTAAEAARGVAGLSADTADAVRAAQRAIELDPLRDSSWLLLAELQDRLGDPTAAAATMREHARVTAELSPAPACTRWTTCAGLIAATTASSRSRSICRPGSGNTRTTTAGVGSPGSGSSASTDQDAAPDSTASARTPSSALTASSIPRRVPCQPCSSLVERNSSRCRTGS